MNIYRTRLKLLLRSKENLFWTFFFPCILGIFFAISFGRLSNDVLIDTQRVFVASDYSDENMVNVMEEAMIREDVPLFQVSIANTKEVLEDHLQQGDISGYVFVDDEGQIFYRIRQSGLTQTITKSFLDQYIQTTSLIFFIQTTHPAELESVLTDLQTERVYFESLSTQTNESTNNMIMYFYALIAMACMFASYWGIGLINDVQANMSHVGVRVGVAPTHKAKLLIAYFLAAWTVHFSGNIILIMFLKFVLQVDFGNQLGLVLFAAFAGSFSGIALGAMLSSIVKGPSSKKEGLCTAISLILSFLSGLMFIEVKYFVSQNIPILTIINPAYLLTDALYRLYYFIDYGLYWTNIAGLFALSLVLLFITYIRIRGEKYESI